LVGRGRGMQHQPGEEVARPKRGFVTGRRRASYDAMRRKTYCVEAAHDEALGHAAAELGITQSGLLNQILDDALGHK
jgi:hypothetical protein